MVCLLALGSASLVIGVCITTVDDPKTAMFVGDSVGDGTGVQFVRGADDGPNLFVLLSPC